MTIPPVWRKSSRSTQGTSDQCVEVAQLSASIGIRDSKATSGDHLSVTPAAFKDLVEAVKAGQF